MLKKSHSRASASAISAADGTSIMIPTGSSGSNAWPAARIASFASSRISRARRSSSIDEIIGNKQPHVARGARAQDRAQLGAERLEVREREPDRAQAQLRVVLVRQREIRHLLVTAEIERADRHGPRREQRGDALVELLLLLLLGEAAVRDREHLGAEQAHALRAVLLDQPQIRDEAAVRGERDAPAVARLGGQRAQRVEVLGGDLEPLARALIFGDEPLVGRQEHRALATVDDRELAGPDRRDQAGYAGHRGDLERAREDRAV